MSQRVNHVMPNETRRGFIRGSSLLLASALPGAAKAEQSPKLRLGVIGCGRSGIQLASAAMQAGRVELVALADSCQSNLQQACRTLKGKAKSSFQVDSNRRFLGREGYRDLLDQDLDWVIIAVPYGLRAAMTAEAVACGKCVYVEQPMAVDVEGLALLSRANREAAIRKVALVSGNRLDFDLRFGELLAALEQGLIGRIERIRADSCFSNTWLAAKQKFATNWKHVPSLAGDGTLGHRSALARLAARLSGCVPQSAHALSHVEFGEIAGGVSQLDSRVLFESGDLRMESRCRMASRYSAAREIVEIFGSEGRCELHKGAAYNSQGVRIFQMDAGRTHRAQALLEALSRIEHQGGREQLGKQFLESLEETRSAILAQSAAQAGGRILRKTVSV